MRRYYFLIGLFVLSLIICTIGCDVNNETIKILHEDQNEEASKTATSFIDFAEAYEDALDSLNSLEPDDPNALEVLGDISATLGSLADDMVASTANLISLEVQIQIQSALVSTQVIKPKGLVQGTLVILTISGAAALIGKGVVDVWGVCTSLPQLPGEHNTQHAARILTCIRDNAPQAVLDTMKTVVVTSGEAVAVHALPHGKIKAAAEVLQAGEAGLHVTDFIGLKQDGCSPLDPQDNPRIQNSVPINSVAAALQDDISPRDLYIAQSDGSDDGVFPFIPEGDWSFLAFTPDHKATYIPCVHVSADQTTDITIVITPIDEDDDVTTTTTIDEDDDVTDFPAYYKGTYAQTSLADGCTITGNARFSIYETGVASIALQPLKDSCDPDPYYPYEWVFSGNHSNGSFQIEIGYNWTMNGTYNTESMSGSATGPYTSITVNATRTPSL